MQKAEQLFEEGSIGEMGTPAQASVRANTEALRQAQQIYEKLVKNTPKIEHNYSVMHRLSRTYIELARQSEGSQRVDYLAKAKNYLKTIREAHETSSVESIQADYATALIAELCGDYQTAIDVADTALGSLGEEAQEHYVKRQLLSLTERCNRLATPNRAG